MAQQFSTSILQLHVFQVFFQFFAQFTIFTGDFFHYHCVLVAQYRFTLILRGCLEKVVPTLIAELHDNFMLCGRYLQLAVSNERSTPSTAKEMGQKR